MVDASSVAMRLSCIVGVRRGSPCRHFRIDDMYQRRRRESRKMQDGGKARRSILLSSYYRSIQAASNLTMIMERPHSDHGMFSLLSEYIFI